MGNEAAEAGSGKGRKKPHWGLKALIAGLIVFVAYSAFGFLAAPRIIRSKLDSALESALGRSVEIGEVSFNPYSLALDVQGISVAGKDTDDELFSLEALHLSLSHISIIEWAVVLGDLRLVRPKAHLVYREAGTYNISDLTSGPESEGKPAEERSAFRFVLRRFVVEGGEMTFDDRALNRKHSVEDFNLNVPFASTLPEDSSEPVQPVLSARINGTPVTLTGKVLPFSEPLKAEFAIKIDGSDLTDYWAYAPLPSVVGLKSGKLFADASLIFELTPDLTPKLYFRGDYRLEDVALTGRGNAGILGFESLSLKLKDVGVFDRVIRAESIELRSPYLAVTRLEDGAFDWLDYLPIVPAGAEPAGDEPAEANDASKAAVHLEADRLRVTGGRVDFQDLSVPGGFKYRLSPIWISAEKVNTADDAPARLTASIGEEGAGLISISADFGVLPLQADGAVTLSGIAPADFKAYFKDYLPLEVASGVLGGHLEFSVPASGAADSRIERFDLELADLDLKAAKPDGPRIKASSLSVSGGPVDPINRVLAVEEVLVKGANLALARDKDGNIDLAALFAGSGSEANPEPAAPEGEKAPEWDLAVGSTRIENASVSFTDRAAPRPGLIEVRDLSASLSDFRPWPGREMPLTLSAKPAAGGKLAFNGSVSLPGKVAGDLKADGLSLAPASMYLPENSSMTVAHGGLSLNGRLEASADGLGFSFKGGIGLSDLSMRERDGGGDLLELAGLDIRDLDIQGLPLKIRASALSLSNPDASITVDPDGETNLGRALAGLAGGGQDGEQASKEQVPEEPGQGLGSLSLGSITVQGGRLGYTDRSLDPAFETDVTEFNARIDDVDLTAGKTSRVKIGAVIGGGASLSVDGSLDFLKSGAETDLDLSVRNMALPPLTPYSIRYIAYPLVNGKLYADVKIDIHDMKLTADNRFRLERLEVGDKVPSETAADVPIKLAMALLTDSAGNMILDVPVEGRLDDPEFRLGGVIFKAVISLFTKIVTAPFSFIGAIFGGGDDTENVGVIDFAAGSGELDETGRGKLGTVAQAMSKRPGLRIEMSGYADPEADAVGLERMRVRQLVLAQKIKAMGASAPKDTSLVKISEKEYPAYLEMALRQATGRSPKGLDVAAMEENLAQEVTVVEEDLRSLARSRSRAAADYLTGGLGVEPSRIFVRDQDALSASKDKGASGARVELGLTR